MISDSAIRPGLVVMIAVGSRVGVRAVVVRDAQSERGNRRHFYWLKSAHDDEPFGYYAAAELDLAPEHLAACRLGAAEADGT